MPSFESFLYYQRFRHLKLMLLGLAVATLIYALDDPPGGRSGGSWYGYATGGIAAALILWLMWFGGRKRSYFSGSKNLKSWLSAHVYLGLGLLLLVPLHCAFQFGLNVHTLAYALMCVVILSGMVGVAVYAFSPTLIADNRPGQKLEALFQQVVDLDSEWREVAKPMPDFVAQATHVGIEETKIGGGILRQLSGHDPRCGTERAKQMINARAGDLQGEDLERWGQLSELIERKRVLLKRIRLDVRYKALLNVWLLVHIPLAFATVAAVAAHVFVVFYYR